VLYIETQNEGKWPAESIVYGLHILYRCLEKKQVGHCIGFAEGPPERTGGLERDSGTGDFSPLVQMSPLVLQQPPSAKRDKLD